jgi:hypothetical protein
MKLLPMLGCLALPLAAGASPLSVTTDLSGSAPLLVDEHFAKLAAYAAIEKFDQLQTGDVFTYRTLGVTGFKNFGGWSKRVKRSKKKKLRKKLFKSIAYIPKNQDIQSQSETNILYFLNYTDFDCANGETVFIITDALESSNSISGYDLVQGTPLPKPEADLLKGCHITMYGLGLTENPMSPHHIKNLLSAWQDWMRIAGADFKAVINP